MNNTLVAILLLLSIDTFADIDIDARIEQIQNAPAKDRVRLMNAFKKELRVMNEKLRVKAIKSFQTKQNIVQNNAFQDSVEQTQFISQEVTAPQNMIENINNTGNF